jgi:hypothetical protein
VPVDAIPSDVLAIKRVTGNQEFFFGKKEWTGRNDFRIEKSLDSRDRGMEAYGWGMELTFFVDTGCFVFEEFACSKHIPLIRMNFVGR